MNTNSSACSLRSRHLERLCGTALLLLLAAATSGCTDLKRWAYASGNRDSWQQSQRVIAELELKAGAHIADLGSGGGYFTFELADAVGADGVVYAVDVDEAMNEALEEDARERGYANVRTVLAPYDEPGLAPGSVELIFTSNTYHHLEERVQYWKNAAAALAPGARVAIIDYKPEGWFQKRHGTAAASIREEMEAAGYRLAKEHDFLERQHFLVFDAPER